MNVYCYGRMFEDLLQDSTLQANPGSYQSVVLVLSDGLVKVPTAFTVSCWVNIASASPYELPLAGV